MANWWLNRLVVRGPIAEVAAFRKAGTMGRACRLSFQRLLASLPPAQAAGLTTETQDPADLGVDLLVRRGRGMAELAYRFQLSRYEPDELLIRVSTLHPSLCFSLGWVDPASDSQGSKLIHNGRSWVYTLPKRRKAALLSRVTPRASAMASDRNDQMLTALIEADWAMMDEVIEHWDAKITALLDRNARRRRTARPPSRSRRRRRRG